MAALGKDSALGLEHLVSREQGLAGWDQVESMIAKYRGSRRCEAKLEGDDGKGRQTGKRIFTGNRGETVIFFSCPFC